jgi:flagellar basal-body rod modification protein FlgD
MATVDNPVTASQVVSAITPVADNATSQSKINATIADNFDTFLQLLTTQLKNQNPLDPLDTNQFTQQLVQFAQVEQQINTNQQLETLIGLQKAANTTTALSFLGATATVEGSTARLANGQAVWAFSSPKPASATINIRNAAGQVVYTENRTLTAGPQSFTWNGRGIDASQWPDGNYTIAITAKDASSQSVAISTEVEGVVDGVDLTQNPPVLKIGGQDFTLDKVKQVVRPGLTSL